jgi:hypothetical protein
MNESDHDYFARRAAEERAAAEREQHPFARQAHEELALRYEAAAAAAIGTVLRGPGFASLPPAASQAKTATEA